MRRMLGWIVLGLSVGWVYAQAEVPASVTVTADLPAEVALVLAAGETITITGHSVALDPTLLLRDDRNNAVAYADDRLDSGTIISDAQLTFTSASGGDYRLVIDSFNGVSEGEVTLTSERHTEPLLTVAVPLTVKVAAQQVTVVQLVLTQPQSVRFTVRDLDATLDPWLQVVDEAGQGVASGDDSEGQPGLNMLDSALTASLAAGRYQLRVLDWLGRAGRVEITLRASSE